jgi:hypothetical protein
MCLRLLLFLCLASERRREGHAWSGEAGREHPPRCSPGCPLRLRFLRLLLRVSAAPIICGMGLFSFRQSAVGARWSGRCIPFLGALLVQVTAPSLQAERRLLAVCPDVAELLAIVRSQSQSYLTTDGQSASPSWHKAPIWNLGPDFYFCQTVAGLLMWGALSLRRGRVCHLQLLLLLASSKDNDTRETKMYILSISHP